MHDRQAHLAGEQLFDPGLCSRKGLGEMRPLSTLKFASPRQIFRHQDVAQSLELVSLAVGGLSDSRTPIGNHLPKGFILFTDYAIVRGLIIWTPSVQWAQEIKHRLEVSNPARPGSKPNRPNGLYGENPICSFQLGMAKHGLTAMCPRDVLTKQDSQCPTS